MNILSSSAETWRAIFEFASIAGAVIALLAGAISVGSLIGIAVTDRVIKRNQAEEDRQKAEKLLTLEKETADAKRKLLEAQKEFEGRLSPIYTSERLEKMRTYLKGHLKTTPKATIELFSQSGDPEARNFARNVADVLSSAGWLLGPVPKPRENTYGEVDIRARDAVDAEAVLIRDAISFAFGEQMGAGMGTSRDETLPEGRIDIVFGARLAKPFKKPENDK